MIQNIGFKNTPRNRLSVYKSSGNVFDENTFVFWDLGDRVVFTEVYNKLYSYAFYFAKQMLPQEDSADIVAAVFSKMWVHKKTFENISHIKNYVRVSVKNACISYLRNKTSRTLIEEKSYAELYGNELENILSFSEIGAERLRLIYIEIEKLPTRNREIFKLAYLNNLKNPEIAQRLGITTRTVQNQKSSALKMLRMTLLSLITICFNFYLSLI